MNGPEEDLSNLSEEGSDVIDSSDEYDEIT